MIRVMVRGFYGRDSARILSGADLEIEEVRRVCGR